jgi:hypothetical protein
MIRVIPGAVDWRDLAERYRPTDVDALAAEIRRLHASGLKARDLSTALRLPLNEVLDMIQNPRREYRQE